MARFNGELVSAQLGGANAIELSYLGSARACAVLNRKPAGAKKIDGAESIPDPAGPNAIFLLRGQHFVTIHTE